MQYGKVEICGLDTSRLKVLSEERKRELMELIRSGTPQQQKQARDEMIQGNLRLVLSVIHRFRNRGEELDDLFQVGVIGLMKAINNFDPNLDVRFSTYGVPMMWSGRNTINDGGTFMSIITTAEAIRIGIESIEARADIPPKTQLDAIRLLRSLEKADWHRNWTRESIIQALNEYKERTGKAPTVTNLKEHGMPKGVTIQKVFQMSPSLLLKRLFPENRKMKHVNPALSNPYGFDSEIEWLNCFREQFEKHKHEEMSCKQYNVLRDESTPTWNTIARYCKCSGWTALMKKAGVAYPEKRIETAHDIRVVSASSPIVEKLEAINREKERLTREYLDAIVSRR